AVGTCSEDSGRPPRRVPVVMLLDGSGSMLANEVEDKIGVLNRAMAGILPALAGLDPVRGQADIGVVVFGGTGARVHLSLGPASAAAWTDLTASGKTPAGAAFGLARQMLDAPGAMPEDSLEPVLVLVSDGVP